MTMRKAGDVIVNLTTATQLRLRLHHCYTRWAIVKLPHTLSLVIASHNK